MFAPTTIGALVWATEFLHEGRNLSIGEATTAASMVPIGWIMGCQLAGYVSDKIGRRKPVLLTGAVIILLSLIAAIYVPAGFALRYTIALMLGIASGAAIPFTIVKEVSPDKVKGSASGAMKFLCFMVTGLLTAARTREIVALTTQQKPANATLWSTRSMAAASGVSEASVRRVWKAHGLRPHRIESFKLSNDPRFAEKLEDIVELYLNPPEHALVLCLDEKSQIAACSPKKQQEQIVHCMRRGCRTTADKIR